MIYTGLTTFLPHTARYVEANRDTSGGPDSCWNWTKTKCSRGYGVLLQGSRFAKPHRVAWFIANGEIPANMHVLHSCDNPSCCNPKHLFLGTQLDNMQDKVAKNRQAKGEKNGRAKLTAEQVKEIRSTVFTKHRGIVAISREYGVSRRMIRYILDGVNW